MPNNQFIKIENFGSLKVFKRLKSKFYYVKFYVGKSDQVKKGYVELSLKTISKTTAKQLAKEKYLEYVNNNQSNPKLTKSNVTKELQFDYFYRKYHCDLIELASINEIDPKAVITSETRYITEIKDVLGNLDIKDVNKTEIERLKIKLIKKNKQGKTINGYFSIIKNVLKKAIDLNAIEKLPVFPKIKLNTTNNPNSYQPYTADEIHLIVKELRRLSKTNNKYSHYDEIADIVNFLYFVPLRPGKEYLSLTHNDVRFVTDISSGKKLEILIIDPPSRKVQQYRQPIPSHPIATDIYKSRVLKRYPKITGREFLFFNNEPNRDMNKVSRKIYKVFAKISKKLNLYYVPNSTRNRPLYSIRTSNFIETYARSGQLDLTAKVGNSSAKMLNNAYLNKFSTLKVIDIYHKLYSNNYSKNKK
jgi:hypothetical protein